jgi:hypothetical protein
MPDDASLSPAEPCVGPWYWVYLRPRWRLFAAPVRAEQETIGHPEFWRQIVVGFLAPHYGVTNPRKIEMLAQLCYSMPRGRCAMPMRRPGHPPSWAVYHGGEFPAGSDPENLKRTLLRRFGLTTEAKRGGVRFVLDEHEIMQDDDQRRLQRIIGPVPY